MAGFRSELAGRECTGIHACAHTCALYEARVGGGVNSHRAPAPSLVSNLVFDFIFPAVLVLLFMNFHMRKLNREKSYNLLMVTQVVNGRAELKPGSSDAEATPSGKPRPWRPRPSRSHAAPSPNRPWNTKLELSK